MQGSDKQNDNIKNDTKIDSNIKGVIYILIYTKKKKENKKHTLAAQPLAHDNNTKGFTT